MNFYTQGRDYHPEMIVPLECINDNFGIHNFTRDYFKLIIVDSGGGIVDVNGKKLPFCSPSVFCFNESDKVLMKKKESVNTSEIYFQPEVVNSKLTIENLRGSSLQLSATENQDYSFLQAFLSRDETYFGQITIGQNSFQRIRSLFTTLLDSLTEQKDYFWPCRSRSYFLELLFLLERTRVEPSSMPPRTLPEKSDEMDDIILYLHNNYHEKITLEGLADKFYTNRTSLSKKFKHHFGVPVISYLIKHRISIAASILRDTTIPVEEITGRVGFQDITHFGRVFKKETSLTPSEYRNEYNWMLK